MTQHWHHDYTATGLIEEELPVTEDRKSVRNLDATKRTN
jgi:hypothetical protein